MAAVGRQTLDSETDFAAFFDDAVIGMAVVGLDGRFRAVNGALCRMLGYRVDQLVGRRTVDVTHPDDRQRSLLGLDRLVKGEAVSSQLLKRFMRADGTAVSVIRTGTVLRDAAGQPSGLVTQVMDVSALTELQDTDHHDRARKLLAYHLSAVGVGEPLGCRLRHRDQSWREVHVAATNLLEDPSVAALMFNVRDVTEYERRLERGEHRFQALVANSLDMISLHDAEGRYLLCSPAVRRLGYEPEELVGRDPLELIHPDDRAEVAEALRRVVTGGERGQTIEYRFRHRDGTWRWVESIGARRLDDPSIGAIVTTTRDITESRHRARQQRLVSALGHEALTDGPLEHLTERTLDSIAEVLDLDRCHLVTLSADGASSVTSSIRAPTNERSAPADAGCPVCRQAVDWRDPSALEPHRRSGLMALAAGETGSPATAMRVSPANGPGAFLVVCGRHPDTLGPDDVSFLETVGRILTTARNRQSMEAELRRQALRDGLTGLPNRTLLKDRLQTAISRLTLRGGSVAVLFVDLDNLKLINDSLGHSIGDAVVAAVADRLRDTVSGHDTVARFGGDEFVVVSESTDPAAARGLAERIGRAVSTPLTVAGRTLTVTVSVGCATTDDPGSVADRLLADADTAMYEAKNAGKNTVAVFTPALRQRTTEHLEVVSGIRRGLEAGEFRLYYQPIHDLVAGRVAGHEALLRWQHPTSGLVPPDQFIHYAETSGLIIPLGRWVLHTACAQSAAWRRAGRPSRVTVNVSPRQLSDPDFTDDVASALRASGADPADIHLEVTESALIPGMSRAHAALDALHQVGVHLGLDDFGTGWSSISQLAQLPFDFVKIDRSFVSDIPADQRTSALLESILGLCSTLGLRVIVEGVETAGQLERLEQLGVRMAQGFLLGRPLPPVG